jgi:hypothetical protein
MNINKLHVEFEPDKNLFPKTLIIMELWKKCKVFFIAIEKRLG